MLSSGEKRFRWSRQDRLFDDPPLFRVLARRWRPLVRKVLTRAPASRPQAKRAPPSWNHWLWIK